MNEQGKREEHKSLKNRFIRWQQLTISQLSFTNNLFLGFNLGFLSFFVSQIGVLFCGNYWLFTLQIFSVLSLMISFITGIMTVLNRLRDFRLTKTLVKNRRLKFEDEHNIQKHQDIETTKISIVLDKLLSDELGKKTWLLLKWQIWSFLIGASVGILYLVISKNVVS